MDRKLIEQRLKKDAGNMMIRTKHAVKGFRAPLHSNRPSSKHRFNPLYAMHQQKLSRALGDYLLSKCRIYEDDGGYPVMKDGRAVSFPVRSLHSFKKHFKVVPRDDMSHVKSGSKDSAHNN